ncbi:MAG: amidohydrolase [Planctomycetes bacterium DG_20]|nr:MAG: amidohydrolase [Planctomycetes bacterium DG_20]
MSPTPEGGVSITIDELLCRMDAAGVDRAVTWLQPPYRRDLDEANAYIHRATEDHPDLVRRCLQEYGFYGVKLNGAQNAFFIDDPHLSLPVVEAVALAGGILAFHVGADAFEQTHPFRVAKIARTHPNLPILVVHMGGVGHADLTRATIEFAAECPNLTLIGSAVRAPAVLAAIRTLGAERVCFGSDTPFDLMHVELARYRALLGGEVGDDEKAAVLGGNIARLFGLSNK